MVKLINLIFSVCFATGHIHSGEKKIIISVRQIKLAGYLSAVWRTLIFRPHRMHSARSAKMRRPIVTDILWSVCVSVCWT